MSEQSNLEKKFDITFTAILAQREKQIQQNYRPIIGIHKWFARRPGTVFRNLLLAEFNGEEPIDSSYWRAHEMKGVIADPFMGGGTPIFEANRLGFSVVGTDINPMAFWVVRQSLASLDLRAFTERAEAVMAAVEQEVGTLYMTTCSTCGEMVRVKYFIWVKMEACTVCGTDNDLFPGYLLAEAMRHPYHVVVCSSCGHLNEYDRQPTPADPEPCKECSHPVFVPGVARRQKIICRVCRASYPYPSEQPTGAPRHRMWAIEYYCEQCKTHHKGRFFKKPDRGDLQKFACAEDRLKHDGSHLPIPDDIILDGDETHRLHRWGYTRFREMFNGRQLLGLGLLLRQIIEEAQDEVRHALLTVFSDFLRYQNMLCRYDSYALKCQDIFSVHGFPVGLIQCENSLLGIPKVGSGAFCHFVEKYVRAKQYCLTPFETRFTGRRKELVRIPGERIQAQFLDGFPDRGRQQAWIKAAPATELFLHPESLDGVFTDPPYFDNVQYAELMDFCFVWLRLGLRAEFEAFTPTTTRVAAELTGNVKMQRGFEHFTEGLSKVFRHYARALKAGAPFVFTYHHNDPAAYVPLIVAILDAGLQCSATLPAPAEMGASLHIARSHSSVLDTVFVCRRDVFHAHDPLVEERMRTDVMALRRAGLKVTEGDIRCLLAGHVARLATRRLSSTWDVELAVSQKMALSHETVSQIGIEVNIERVISQLTGNVRSAHLSGDTHAAAI